MPLRYEPIELGHQPQLDSFVCGDAESEVEISDFLKYSAVADQKARVSRTYLAFESETGVFVGYYTLYAGTIRTPRSFTKSFGGRPKNVPAIFIGHIGVCRDLQGGGKGTELLEDALTLAYRISQYLGAVVVALHAYRKAADWYAKRDFCYIRQANRFAEEDPLGTEAMYFPLDQLDVVG